MFRGLKAAAVVTALTLFSTAWAQQAPSVVPTPEGVVIQGSLTVDGVEYTAEDLTALARTYQTHPLAMPAMPPALYTVVTELAAALPRQGQ